MPILQRQIKVGGELLTAWTTITKDHPHYEEIVPFFNEEEVDVPVSNKSQRLSDLEKKKKSKTATKAKDKTPNEDEGGADSQQDPQDDEWDADGIDSMTKAQIIEKLTEQGQEFNPKARKEELYALL